MSTDSYRRVPAAMIAALHWVRDVTYDEDRSQVRTGTGPEVMPLCATPPSARYAPPESPPSPPAPAITPAIVAAHWPSSASPNDFAGALPDPVA
jgi:hypothetical protein